MTNVVVLLGDINKPDIVKPGGQFDLDDYDTIRRLKDALSQIQKNNKFEFTYIDSHQNLIENLKQLNKEKKIDMVFNLCDEGFDNIPEMELHIPALLEILKLPYTGSPPQCLAYCYDKFLIKSLCRNLNIPTADYTYLSKNETSNLNLLFSMPAIVKPNTGDGSFGINQSSVVYNTEQLNKAIENIKKNFNRDILIEKYLKGREFSLGIIGNIHSNYLILPLIEEDYSAIPDDLPKICGYEAKWLPESPYWNVKSKLAIIPDSVKQTIEKNSLKILEKINYKDYCRLDWRLDENENPFLLEVNPNPGWCFDGHLAKMCNFANISYTEMLGKILDSSYERNNK